MGLPDIIRLIMEEQQKTQHLFGIHPVIEAIRAGKTIEKVLVKQGMDGPQYRELMSLVTSARIQYQFVPVERLNRIEKGAHQGVVAYIPKIEYVDHEVLINNALTTSKAPLVVILDGVSDVRNLGAIARTLECTGGSGIILPAKGGAAINAEAIKASAGALMRIDVAKVPNLKLAAYSLKHNGFKIISATEKAERKIYSVDMTGPCAIVMGSEGKGISKGMLELSDETAAIPMAGGISSLNVSVATAMVLYEAVRQRNVAAGNL